ARTRGAGGARLPLAAGPRRSALLALGRRRDLPERGNDAVPGRHRSGLPAVGARQVGPDGLPAIRLPPLHDRRAREPRLLPDSRSEPGVAVDRIVPEYTMSDVILTLSAGLLLLTACSDIATPIRDDFYEWRLIVPAPSGTGVDSLTFHWPKDRLPVHVWVEDAANLTENVPKAITAWRAAFLYREFDAAVVSDSSKADIIVRAGPAPGVPLFSRTRLGSAFAPECSGATDIDVSDDHTQLRLPIRIYIDPL